MVMRGLEAVLVLGGGVREGGSLPPWAKARFDLALNLAGDAVFMCLSAATTHRPPPLDGQGFPISEAVAGARYLVNNGVPAERIRLEATSLDTIGNAWFSKVLHVDPAGWSRVLVVTSEFHMPRTESIFTWIYGSEPGKYALSFAASPNDGITPEGLQARNTREQRSLQNLRGIQQQLRTPRQLYSWIYAEHDAYSVTGQLRPRPPLDPEVMESY